MMVVVGTLQENGVYRHIWAHAVIGEASGECYRVAFADADIENTVGHYGLHGPDRCPPDSIAAANSLRFQGFGVQSSTSVSAEYVTELFWRCCRVVFAEYRSPVSGLNLPGACQHAGFCLGRGIAFAFDCAQVEYAWAVHVAYVVEYAHDSG